VAAEAAPHLRDEFAIKPGDETAICKNIVSRRTFLARRSAESGQK